MCTEYVDQLVFFDVEFLNTLIRCCANYFYYGALVYTVFSL